MIRKRSNSIKYYGNISFKVQKCNEEVEVDERAYAEVIEVETKDESSQVDLTEGLYKAEILGVPNAC